MELPEPEPEPASPRCRRCSCCCRPVVLRGAPAAVWWALLACALLSALGALLAALLPAHRGSPDDPDPARLRRGSGGAPLAPSGSHGGARLLLDGPGKTMRTGRLEWYADNIMDGVHLGPGFEYNPASHVLKVKNRGLYFIYAQLSAVRVSRRSSKERGNATLTIHRKAGHSSDLILTLPLHLSSRSNKSLAAFTAISPRQLAEGDLLYVMLTMSDTAGEGQRNSTGWYFGDCTVFGLSPVSGNCDSESTGVGDCLPAALEVERILKYPGRFFQNNA